MASIYDLKPAFQNLIRPLSEWLVRKQMTPNQITIAAFILSLLNGLAIASCPDAKWPLFFIPITLFLRMMLNAIDGMMAREHAMQTTLGAFLNEIGDVLSDAALYLPLAFVTGISSVLITLIVVLAVTSEMTGVVAVQVGGSRRYDGPMGKSDRAFVFGALGFLMGIGFNILGWVNLLLKLVVLLLMVTIVNRVRSALQTI